MVSLAGFPGICPECGGLLALAIDSSVVVCSKSTLSLPANKYSVTNQLHSGCCLGAALPLVFVLIPFQLLGSLCQMNVCNL